MANSDPGQSIHALAQERKTYSDKNIWIGFAWLFLGLIFLYFFASSDAISIFSFSNLAYKSALVLALLSLAVGGNYLRTAGYATKGALAEEIVGEIVKELSREKGWKAEFNYAFANSKGDIDIVVTTPHATICVDVKSSLPHTLPYYIQRKHLDGCIRQTMRFKKENDHGAWVEAVLCYMEIEEGYFRQGELANKKVWIVDFKNLRDLLLRLGTGRRGGFR